MATLATVPLPTDPNAPWPPTGWQPIQRDIEEAAVWYEGDKRKLAAFYGNGSPARPSERVNRQGFLQRAMFWARRADDGHTDRQQLHVPAAADVASTAADLLFGDEARLVIPEAHEFTETEAGDDEGTEPALTNDPVALAAEDRLAELADLDGWASTLLEGAEVCAALGGVYLRAGWDEAVVDHPMLTVVHADHAVPEFRSGKLVAVTFWTVLETTGRNEVVRHLERHEEGVILHGVYVGTTKALGNQVALTAFPATADLADVVQLPEGIRLDVEYVPNVRPNRKHRGVPVGRADVAETWDLMDALDETWTSWMRDIRIGKGRIIVPDEFLDRRGRGSGAIFDLDREVFSPLGMDPANMERAGITVAQFEIRAEQHAATIAELFERIVVTAGYSPQSFGMQGDGGGQQTATEVSAREGRSLRTTARKQRYWRAAERTALNLLIIDRAVFGTDVEPMRPRLEFADPDENDPREIGSTLNLLNLARAASTETKVRMLNPDWDDPQVQAEVRRIQDEEGLGPSAAADPTGGLL